MSWYGDAWGGFKNFMGGPSGGDPNKLKLPGYEEDRDLIAGKMAQGTGPFQNASSYTGDWRSLINQIQNGPSVAQAQYQGAVQQGQAGVSAMARNGARPGTQTMAFNRQADMTQGLAGGSAQAMAQEQAQRTQALQGALSGASEVEGRVNQANQQAWMNLLASRLGLNQQQFQVLLAREQLRQQQSQQPSGFERTMKVVGDISAMMSQGNAGQQGAGAAKGGGGASALASLPPIPV